jgi:tRNA uridine 5-carboxymethylaminomethyl modification enzyme
LFFAGQINGTTGYEEAGGQGIIAGINGALFAKNSNQEFILNRSQSYIAVMIDDLTSLGTVEPYRMLTSRAEHRLHLRADNADLRLTELGYEIGVVGNQRREVFLARKNKIAEAKKLLEELKISPVKLAKYNVNIKQDGVVRNWYQLLSFPDINFEILERIWGEVLSPSNSQIDQSTKKQIAIDATYSAYLDRAQRDIDLFSKEENMKIPLELDYYKIQSLSHEVREKLTKFRPATIAIANRIQGITPASLMAIMIFIKNNFYSKKINKNFQNEQENINNIQSQEI